MKKYDSFEDLREDKINNLETAVKTARDKVNSIHATLIINGNFDDIAKINKQYKEFNKTMDYMASLINLLKKNEESAKFVKSYIGGGY